MPFRSRGNRLRPVNSEKHIRTQQIGGVLDNQNVLNLAIAVPNPDTTANAEQVQVGSTIIGIYLKVEVSPTTEGALPNFYMAVAKNPGNTFVFPKVNVLGLSDLKKFVIHQEMVMLSNSSTPIPRTVFAGVIRIPRGYKRMGVNDRIVLLTFAPGVNTEICYEVIYKEFR